MHTDTEIQPGTWHPFDDRLAGTFSPAWEGETDLLIGGFGPGHSRNESNTPVCPTSPPLACGLGRALSLTIELRFHKIR